MVNLALPNPVDDQARLDRVNLGLSGLLFLSPWLLGYATLTSASIAAWVSAIVIGIVAMGATLRFAEWEEWMSLLAGVWLVAAPWALHFAYAGGALAAFTGVGIVICAISVTELWAVHHPGWLQKDVRGEGPKKAD